MARTTIAVQPETLEALNELRWTYRARSIDDVIKRLIADTAPDIYQEIFCEDLPEE